MLKTTSAVLLFIVVIVGGARFLSQSAIGQVPKVADKDAVDGTRPRHLEIDVTAPVMYKDMMLILVTSDGAAAIVFTDVTEAPDGKSVNRVVYRFRYESRDGKTKTSGSGVVFETQNEKKEIVGQFFI